MGQCLVKVQLVGVRPELNNHFGFGSALDADKPKMYNTVQRFALLIPKTV